MLRWGYQGHGLVSVLMVELMMCRISSNQNDSTFLWFYETWPLIHCQNPKSCPEEKNSIYNSPQGVHKPTEKHLKSKPGNRILPQEIGSLKFSIKALLNWCVLCPHKTGYIDVLNQNIFIINLSNDFMGYGTDIFK